MGALESQTEMANRPRWWLRILAAFAILALGAASGAWFSRESIAGDLIDGYLAQSGVEATYDIVSIGPQQQIVENLVIGDPEAPDLTIDRLTIGMSYGFGTPTVGSAIVERPRLFATYGDGELSFGALDSILFGPGEESAGLPDIELRVIDGGARIDTDYGDIGVFFEGDGPLQDGFAGTLAATAPGFAVEGCSSKDLTAYGDLSMSNGSPVFDGPVRLRDVTCSGMVLASADTNARLLFDFDDSSVDGRLSLSLERLRSDNAAIDSATGSIDLAYRDGALTLDHDVELEQLSTSYGSLDLVSATGELRSQQDFARSDWRLDIEGEGVTPSTSVFEGLVAAQESVQGTFAASLIEKFKRAGSASLRNSSLRADLRWRMSDGRQSLVVPEARLRSHQGETLLAVSRFAWSASQEGSASELSANFITGGEGIPRINGRMEQAGNAGVALRMSMAEYADGRDRIAIPTLSVRQDARGGFRFAGLLKAGGALPGGAVSGLQVPLNGVVDRNGALSLGTSCENVRFASLALYDLALEDQALRLCPADGTAMVRYADTLRVGAKTEALAISGQVGDSPASFAAGGAVLRYPGNFELIDIAATLGEPDSALSVSATRLSGAIGDEVSGSIQGGSGRLSAVPLDFSQVSGRWAYVDDELRLGDAQFVLTDAAPEGPRFKPLRGQSASLAFSDGVVAAQTDLVSEANKSASVAEVAILHNLDSAVGSAMIDVPGVTFGQDFGLDDLSDLFRGIVVFADGTVTGEGRVNWEGEDIESSGVFRTDGFDLAAAFGPVEQLKGEVRFSDLVNLTTEPGQVVEIGSINPGIEVIGGQLRFSLTNGELIEVEDARWPFMGGELIMRPTSLRYGTNEEQRYTFEMVALDAAKFVAQMELSNIGATGLFDGTVPIIFDVEGNGRIEGGLLISRAPGGNVSYIGELTYEDLGTMGNYAFQSLRSLDYSQMSVELNGDIAGEIITRFQFDGVRQGEGASRNFVTKRLSKLPIRFNINVRSENFYELAMMARRFWDPDALPNPAEQGVFGIENGRFAVPPERRSPPRSPSDEVRPETPGTLREDETGVQPPESEAVP